MIGYVCRAHSEDSAMLRWVCAVRIRAHLLTVLINACGGDSLLYVCVHASRVDETQFKWRNVKSARNGRQRSLHHFYRWLRVSQCRCLKIINPFSLIFFLRFNIFVNLFLGVCLLAEYINKMLKFTISENSGW